MSDTHNSEQSVMPPENWFDKVMTAFDKFNQYNDQVREREAEFQKAVQDAVRNNGVGITANKTSINENRQLISHHFAILVCHLQF